MKRYALVIGIAKNKYPLGSIAQAAADAQAMASLLETHGGFRVTRLIGTVSRDEIAQAFKAFWQQAAHGEALVFYSGHGLQVVDGDEFDPPEVVLAPSNCEVVLDNKNRVISAGNGLKLNSLNKQLAQAKFSNLVVLLDCCHSGFLLEEEPLKQTFQGLGGRDYVLLTACRSHETAWADGKSPYSVFTQVVLEGLSESEADEQGVVTTDALIAYVKKRLRTADQEPVSLGTCRELELVRYRSQPEPAAQRSEECPYQGLEAFTAQTEQYFFGREAEATELLRRLERCNFVPVIGPSGMGKSSVVRAGLVPRWQRQGGAVVIMKPDEAPFVMLKQALKAHWGDGVSLGEQRRLCGLLDGGLLDGGLSNGETGLVALAQELPGEGRLLLVVDQFEELFTICRPEVAKRFIEQLVAVGLAADSRLAVVMTMRSEFVTDWLLATEIPEAINGQKLEVRPLRGPGLRDAIAQPAELQGYGLGPGLLELILADVESEPNSLPLLEFALTELWEQRDQGQKRLTAAAYRGMGGLKGALNKRAGAVYGAMGEAEQEIARKVCLQLVRIGKGETDTRWRRTKAELLGLGMGEAQQQRIGDVVDTLVKGRLLVTDGDDAEATVDVAHEALISQWQQFVEWRQVDRDRLRLRQRAEDAYGEWKERGRGDNYLMPGGLLEELRELAAAERDELLGSADLSDFFRLSDAAEQKRVATLKEALVIAHLNEECTKALNLPTSESVNQALLAIKIFGDNLDRFKQPLAAAENLLKQAWDNLRSRHNQTKHSDYVRSIALSPLGTNIVSGQHNGNLKLWNYEGQQISSPICGHSDAVLSISFSQTGNQIISGSADQTLRLWNVEEDPTCISCQDHPGAVNAVAFSSTGKHIISCSFLTNTLLLWTLSGDQLTSAPQKLKFQSLSRSSPCPIASLAFSPNGKRVITGSSDCRLYLWSIENDRLILEKTLRNLLLKGIQILSAQ